MAGKLAQQGCRVAICARNSETLQRASYLAIKHGVYVFGPTLEEATNTAVEEARDRGDWR